MSMAVYMRQIFNSYIDFIKLKMHNHMPDPHEVFQARMEKFKFAIKKYKNDNLKVINEKADREEEFELNKIKGEANIRNEDSFKRMEDNIKVAEKIFKSRKINQCRMSEMKVRFDMIEKVQEDTKNQLKRQKADLNGYKQLLRVLIKQGLIKLLEEEVEIRCLKEDIPIVKEVLAGCEKQFNEECDVKTKITITDRNFLIDADLGGVTLTSLKGRIVCDNTLRARLSYCMQLLLPEIRGMLFKDSDQYLSQRRRLKKQAQANARRLHAQGKVLGQVRH